MPDGIELIPYVVSAAAVLLAVVMTVLETVLERLLSAWVGASTRRESELPALATSAAAEQLLHPAEAPEAEIVVHDLALVSFTPLRLEHARSTTLTLELEVSGVRYVRHPDDPLLLGGSQVPIGRDALPVEAGARARRRCRLAA